MQRNYIYALTHSDAKKTAQRNSMYKTTHFKWLNVLYNMRRTLHRNENMKKVIAIISLTLAFSLPAMAHSGGTDSNGCHTDHSTGTRHCH
jgi:hypothetical protein